MEGMVSREAQERRGPVEILVVPDQLEIPDRLDIEAREVQLAQVEMMVVMELME